MAQHDNRDLNPEDVEHIKRMQEKKSTFKQMLEEKEHLKGIEEKQG